jgi:hypothetical protein
MLPTIFFAALQKIKPAHNLARLTQQFHEKFPKTAEHRQVTQHQKTGA